VKGVGVVCAFLVALTGCASITPPYPPSLRLPTRVTDLSAVQRGSHLYIQFTMPKFDTEGLPLESAPDAYLMVGPSARKFDMQEWLKTATEIPNDPGKTLYTTSAQPYVGKDVVVALKLKNEGGHDAGWSNFVTLPVGEAVAAPETVAARATAKGVEISWTRSATGLAEGFRVYRKVPDGDFAPLGEVKQSPFLDATAEFGKRYTYFVMGFRGAGESDVSPEVTIAPIDTFAPAVPGGLRAIIGTRSIEITWDRDTEADLGML
jgi:hypothetical protein